jgi:hypothetical protein
MLDNDQVFRKFLFGLRDRFMDIVRNFLKLQLADLGAGGLHL